MTTFTESYQEYADIIKKIEEESDKYLPSKYRTRNTADMILRNVTQNNLGDEITDEMIEKETNILFNN